MIKKIILINCLLAVSLLANAAYIPVAVTGYNADVVANGAGPATASITADFDGAGYALMAANFNPSTGIFPTQYMPSSNIINSAATSGLNYNLASYSSNNSLRITGLNTDSLVFPTPISASEVYVLAATGSGASTVNMVVNFTDGTNQLSAQTVQDWYSGTNYAIQGLGRTNVTTTLNGIDNNTINPRLYEHKIILTGTNPTKLIRSISFTRTITVAGVLNVMGITINSPAAPSCITSPTAPLVGGNVCAGSITLSWPAASGATGYDVYLNTGTTATTAVATNQAATAFTTTLAAGSYAWRVVPSNPNGMATGCATFTFTANPTVTPSITIAASPAGPICASTPVTFTATPVNGGTTPAYQWKNGTINVGTNSGTYTSNTPVNGDAITVVLTGNAACSSPATVTSAPITLSVLPRPSPTITAASDTTFCAGGSVQLNATTGAGYTYIWLLNNSGITPAATNASYTATASGQYRVVVSNGSCSDTSAAKTVTVNPLPAATVSPAGSQSICNGSGIVLSTTSVAGYTYQWKLGGNNIAGETNATYTATVAGSYTVVVTVTGCSAASTPVVISVNPTPGATATAGGPLSFCQGGAVTLTAGATATGITYQWLLNNAIIPGAASSTYSAAASGSYRVRITATATGCADTSSPAIAVNVSAATSNVVAQTGTSPICQGSNIRFQSQNPTTYTFQWYKDALPVAGATTNTYFATAAGSYYVIVTNGACTSTSVARPVAVNPLPIATAIATGPTAFCDGGSVILFGNTATGITYQWKRNGVAIAGATTDNYTATQSGSYSLTVINTATGCTATSTPFVTVVVSTMPLAAISSAGTPTFCQGNNLTLSATIGGGYTYQWQLNGTNIPGATAATYNAGASGIYKVTITNGTCVATSAPFTVSVTPAPPAIITPAGATSFCQGGYVMLNANTGAGLTYQWTLNGIPITGATTSGYKAVSSGSYAVLISDGTCPAIATAIPVTANSIPVAVINITGGYVMSTGAFSAYQWYRNGVAINGAIAQTHTATQDGYYTVVVADALGCTATSSVQHITSLDIDGISTYNDAVKLYPNPATAMVQVEANVPADLLVMSVDGKQLLSAKAAKHIDISALPQGLYLIKISNHATGQLISLQKLVRK